jgi:hypothetical protein
VGSSDLNKGAFSTFVLYRPVTGRMIFGVLAQYLSRLGDLGGSNLDAAQKASAGFCTSKVQIMRKHTTSRLINFKIFSNNP